MGCRYTPLESRRIDDPRKVNENSALSFGRSPSSPSIDSRADRARELILPARRNVSAFFSPRPSRFPLFFTLFDSFPSPLPPFGRFVVYRRARVRGNPCTARSAGRTGGGKNKKVIPEAGEREPDRGSARKISTCKTNDRRGRLILRNSGCHAAR